MVVCHLAKVDVRVRFPSVALYNKFLTESPMQRMLKWVELLAELAFEVLDPE